jgi:hypothetical protein
MEEVVKTGWYFGRRWLIKVTVGGWQPSIGIEESGSAIMRLFNKVTRLWNFGVLKPRIRLSCTDYKL